jgi:transposase
MVALFRSKYGVNSNQIFNWRRLMREGTLSVVRADEEVVTASEVMQLRIRIRELEHLLGKKTLEVEILWAQSHNKARVQ